MKKGKSYIIILILFVILISIAGFNYLFHGPYSREVSKIANAKKEVMEINKIEGFNEFEKYNGQEVYYIGQDEENIYVFNKEYQLIKKEELSTIQLDLVKSTLTNQYGVSDFSTLELGYENKTISYLCRQNSLKGTQYIYLNAQDATEIKFYELGK